jgi:hypothetical protein
LLQNFLFTKYDGGVFSNTIIPTNNNTTLAVSCRREVRLIVPTRFQKPTLLSTKGKEPRKWTDLRVNSSSCTSYRVGGDSSIRGQTQHICTACICAMLFVQSSAMAKVTRFACAHARLHYRGCYTNSSASLAYSEFGVVGTVSVVDSLVGIMMVRATYNRASESDALSKYGFLLQLEESRSAQYFESALGFRHLANDELNVDRYPGQSPIEKFQVLLLPLTTALLYIR